MPSKSKSHLSIDLHKSRDLAKLRSSYTAGDISSGQYGIMAKVESKATEAGYSVDGCHDGSYQITDPEAVLEYRATECDHVMAGVIAAAADWSQRHRLISAAGQTSGQHLSVRPRRVAALTDLQQLTGSPP